MKGKAGTTGKEVETEERGSLKQRVSWEGWHFSAEVAHSWSRHTEESQNAEAVRACWLSPHKQKVVVAERSQWKKAE